MPTYRLNRIVFFSIEKFRNDDREERAAAKKAAKMEKYKEKIEAAKLKEEEEAKKKAEEEEKAKILAEAEAQKKKDAKAAVNATKKQRKILRQLAKCETDFIIIRIFK